MGSAILDESAAPRDTFPFGEGGLLRAASEALKRAQSSRVMGLKQVYRIYFFVPPGLMAPEREGKVERRRFF